MALWFVVLFAIASVTRFSVGDSGRSCNCTQTSVICVIPVDKVSLDDDESSAESNSKMVVFLRNNATATCVNQHLGRNWTRKTPSYQTRFCRPNSKQFAVQQGLSEVKEGQINCQLLSQGYMNLTQMKHVNLVYKVTTLEKLQVKRIEVASRYREPDCQCETHVIKKWVQGTLLPATEWCAEGSNSLLASVQLQGTDCELPSPLQHGSVSCYISDEDQVVTCKIDCHRGYAMNGFNSTITSCRRGKWSIAVTSCIDVDECTDSSHNCDINAHCINTPSSFVCICNTCYSGDGFSCTRITCSVPLLAEGDVFPNSYFCGDAVNFTCHIGYRLSGSRTRRCKADGQWTEQQPNCRDIDECTEGTHNCSLAVCSNTIGSYSCLCQNCYIGDGVNCQLVYCGNLSAPSYGFVSSANSTCGETVTYTCRSGFRLVGSNSRTCLDNGTWNGTTPSCEDINECEENRHNCSGSESELEQELMSGDSSSGDRAFVGGMCSNIVGSYNCTCPHCYMGDGRLCELIDCDNVDSPLYGNVNVSDTTCGSKLSVSCWKGYKLTGPSTRTCQSNGFWSGIAAICEGNGDTDI